MRTDDLIRALAADVTPQRPVFPDMLWILFGSVFAIGALHLWATGVRPDLWAALSAPVTVWKWILPGMIVVTCVPSALRLTQPDAQVGPGRLLLWGVLMVGLALVVWRLRTLPVDAWGMAVQGKTVWFCLASILGIGLPGLIATLIVMRRGATTRPWLSGLIAGLGCAGVATVIYATHCNEDDPLFFVTWYGLSIGLLGSIGAVLGPRILRW